MSRKAIVFVFLIGFVNVRMQSKKERKILHLPPGSNIKDLLGGNWLGKQAKHYNPHYGYEPYWGNGNWVFKEKELPPGITSTSVPLVCGEECLEIYTPFMETGSITVAVKLLSLRSIGEICGRQASNLDYEGCSPNVISWFCSGIKLDDQTRGYETFPTYCKFLDRQCRATFDERRCFPGWIFVHPGPCLVPHSEVFRPFSISDLPIDRMTFYLTSLASLFDNRSIAHTIFEMRD